MKIAVEILAIQITENSAITGVSVGTGEISLTQFADVPDRGSAAEFLLTVETFGRFSGLVINKEKSHLLSLSHSALTDLPSLGLKLVDRTKILGLWFSSPLT